MGYFIEINTILKLPKNFKTNNLKIGKKIKVVKEGEHFLPRKIVEFCDSNYKYLGKVQVQSLTLQENKTIVEAKIIKLFDSKTSEVFSKNFIKQK